MPHWEFRTWCYVVGLFVAIAAWIGLELFDASLFTRKKDHDPEA